MFYQEKTFINRKLCFSADLHIHFLMSFLRHSNATHCVTIFCKYTMRQQRSIAQIFGVTQRCSEKDPPKILEQYHVYSMPMPWWCRHYDFMTFWLQGFEKFINEKKVTFWNFFWHATSGPSSGMSILFWKPDLMRVISDLFIELHISCVVYIAKIFEIGNNCKSEKKLSDTFWWLSYRLQ